MKLPNDVTDMMEKLDATTYNHSFRMWEIAQAMESDFQMEDDHFSTAAFLHDIGKIHISEKILDKRDNLSVLEREVIDLHPYMGYRLLERYGLPEEVKRLVLYHHGLKPKILMQLPDCDSGVIANQAKMLHTLDVFEALTTDRPYKRRMSVAAACDYMEREGGYHKEVIQYLRNHVSDF